MLPQEQSVLREIFLKIESIGVFPFRWEGVKGKPWKIQKKEKIGNRSPLGGSEAQAGELMGGMTVRSFWEGGNSRYGLRL